MSLKKHFQTEILRFKLLSNKARKLFFSTFLYDLASPVSFVFTNAYILGAGGNNILVALFNLGMFIGLPFGVIFNGYLLRHFPFKSLIAGGVILQGITTLTFFFLPNLNSTSTFVTGLILGVLMALYWGNRNFLAQAATTDDQRTYYGGLEQVLSTYVGIIIPFLIGLTVQFISKDSGLIVQGYRLVGIVALLMYAINAFVLWNIEVENPPTKTVFMFRVSRQWKKVRVLEAILGIENGLELFIPGLIVLTFLGGVETLGTLTSLSAAFGAVIIYLMTSRIHHTKRAGRFFFFVMLKIILTLFYTIFFSKEAAWLLILCGPSLLQLKWPLQAAQVMKVLDDEEEGDSTNNYAYVADVEIFLNIGRIVGVGMFFLLSASFSQQITLRFLPILLTASQLGVAYIVFNLAKHSYKHLKHNA